MNTYVIISQTTVPELDSIGENIEVIGVTSSVDDAKELIQTHFNTHFEEDDELDFSDYDSGRTNIVDVNFEYDPEEFGDEPGSFGYIIHKQ